MQDENANNANIGSFEKPRMCCYWVLVEEFKDQAGKTLNSLKHLETWKPQFSVII